MATKHKACIICGPTAIGKTSLALKLARDLSCDIVSADSRQIYQYLDVVTGKDIPAGWQKVQISTTTDFSIIYYTDGSTRLWGYDFILPDRQFSVAQYNQAVTYIYDTYLSSSRPPIVVGGSGWYLSALIQPPQTLQIPPDLKLRTKLSLLSTFELQKRLTEINPAKFNSMNNSDQHNPRRLIRAIEVNLSQPSTNVPNTWETLAIGIKPKDFDNHANVIAKRVLERALKIDDEIEILENQNLITNVVRNTLGYQQWFDYKEGKISWIEALRKWVIAERQYAKRQMTWFNKQPGITWWTSSDNNYSQIASYVQQWYSKNN